MEVGGMAKSGARSFRAEVLEGGLEGRRSR